MVHPAVPAGADGRRLGIAVIDHPAPVKTEHRIDLAALAAVVAIAALVLADELAVERGPDLGAEGLAVPPGEDAQKECFDRHGASLMPPRGCRVQRAASRAGGSAHR